MTGALPKLEEFHDPRFYNDVIDLFGRARSGHVGHWQYSSPKYFGDPVRGAMYWERFLANAKDYYVLRDEVNLIRKSLPQLRAQLGDIATLVDFGCGPSEPVIDKVLPLLRILRAAHYLPVDICERYTEEAASHARSFGVPFVTPIVADYLSEPIEYASEGPVLGVLFGATVSNDPRGIPGYLARLRPSLPPGSVLLVAYDSNQDEEDILRAYLHPDQIAFGSNLLFRIERDLPVVGIRPFRWSYAPIWNAERFCLEHTVAPSQATSFVCGSECITVNADERFTLNTSFKYPPGYFESEASQVGFRTKFVIKGKEERVVLHALDVE